MAPVLSTSHHDNVIDLKNVRCVYNSSSAEKLLSERSHLDSHSRAYFSSRTSFDLIGIEDDHKPFHNLGKIL